PASAAAMIGCFLMGEAYSQRRAERQVKLCAPARLLPAPYTRQQQHPPAATPAGSNAHRRRPPAAKTLS
ncbi:MAG: hypothetical protein KKH37_03775, partial [Alphaproteobacteria bacterium]|nr:hypothetical protein [Alphaproteobacteria bacterium]